MQTRSICFNHRHRAFTLVELLVVIGIIALLIAILMPALVKARQSAITVQCSSDMRQMGQMMYLFANNFGNRFPGYGISKSKPTSTETWVEILNRLVSRRDPVDGPLQRFNYYKIGTLNQQGLKPGFIGCPNTGFEGSSVRPFAPSIFALGGQNVKVGGVYDPPSGVGIPPLYAKFWNPTETYYDYYFQLGAPVTKFKNPGQKFLIIEHGQANDFVIPRRTIGAGTKEYPKLATKQIPFSQPGKMWAFRHPGITANVLYVDGHVAPVHHTDDALSNMGVSWSYSGQDFNDPNQER